MVRAAPGRFRPLWFWRRLRGLLRFRAVGVQADDDCAVLLTLRAGRPRLCVTVSAPVPVTLRTDRLGRRVTGGVNAE